jgi:hypothetical protein
MHHEKETQMTCNLIHANWYNFNFLTEPALQVVIQMLSITDASDTVYNLHSHTEVNMTL